MTKTKTNTKAEPGTAADARPGSKVASIIALLRGPEGATLADLTSATGWLPHTARAALTGLKKKGHIIEREKVEGTSRYRITSSAES